MMSSIAMISLQFGFAGTDVVTQLSLSRGMSPYVLVVYRLAFSTISCALFALILERGEKSKLTLPIFLQVFTMGLLGSVIDLMLFSCAVANTLPAIAFLVEVIYLLFRKEKVDLKKGRYYALVVGVLVTVAGVMTMTLYKGPLVISSDQTESVTAEAPTMAVASADKDLLRGSLCLIIVVVAGSVHFIVKKSTLEKYPAPLSISTLESFLRTVVSLIFALFMEHKTSSAWVIGFDINLFAAAFAGIFSSVIADYVQDLVIEYKGKEFTSAFIPLRMVIVVVMGPFILPQKIYLGGILGVVLIVPGLYSVLWGSYTESQEIVESPIAEV